jgi:hypothetical protein
MLSGSGFYYFSLFQPAPRAVPTPRSPSNLRTKFASHQRRPMSGATEGMASGLHRESRSMPSCVSYRSNFFHARREGRCRRLTDSVEKVGRGCRIRNNRIEEVCHSNQGCALDWLFESKLRCSTLKIFFQHYRPTRDIRSGHELQASEVQLACQQAMQAACSTQHR